MTEDQLRAQEPSAPIGWTPRPPHERLRPISEVHRAIWEAQRERRLRRISEVHRAIWEALREDGWSIDESYSILDAILEGSIPHVSIDYESED